MPKVRELACRNEACNVDMFGVHFVDDLPDDADTDDVACPGCGEREALEGLPG